MHEVMTVPVFIDLHGVELSAAVHVPSEHQTFTQRLIIVEPARGRWFNIDQTLGQCFVFAVCTPSKVDIGKSSSAKMDSVSVLIVRSRIPRDLCIMQIKLFYIAQMFLWPHSTRRELI